MERKWGISNFWALLLGSNEQVFCTRGSKDDWPLYLSTCVFPASFLYIKVAGCRSLSAHNLLKAKLEAWRARLWRSVKKGDPWCEIYLKQQTGQWSVRHLLETFNDISTSEIDSHLLIYPTLFLFAWCGQRSSSARYAIFIFYHDSDLDESKKDREQEFADYPKVKED